MLYTRKLCHFLSKRYRSSRGIKPKIIYSDEFDKGMC